MTADEESIAAGTASSIKTLTAQHSSANRSMLSLFRVYVSVKNNAHVFFSLYFFSFPSVSFLSTSDAAAATVVVVSVVVPFSPFDVELAS